MNLRMITRSLAKTMQANKEKQADYGQGFEFHKIKTQNAIHYSVCTKLKQFVISGKFIGD
jgi:hypothetical protein